MDSNNVKGNLEKLGGKIKETVGELTGNEKLKNEGRADQVKGAAHDALGNLKETGRDAADTIKKQFSE
jgi:uncharacterized protein YjbJ (UPF0337 family)